MRDLVRIADDDLKELTVGQRLRMFGAIAIAMTCGIVSLHGMKVLFTDSKEVPLPGMNQLPGQIAWATALVAMLVVVTFLVRGVIKRRLQWAIAISLLIHFLLCLSVSVVEFRGPLLIPTAAADLPGATPEEFTMPDYAGEEIPNSNPVWEQQSDSETPDNNVDLERAEMQIADAEKPQPVDAGQTQDVEKLESMERQEQVKLAADAAAEMARQEKESDLPTPQQADAPDVATADSAQPMLDVQMEQAKQSSAAPSTDREQTEIASSAQQPESAELRARRAEAAVNPEDVQADMAPKSNTEPEAAMAASEDVNVSTSDAQKMDVREQPIEIARQQAHSAVLREGIGSRPHHCRVARRRHGRLPHQGVVDQNRFIAVIGEISARDSHDVTVQQPGIEQFPDDESDAPGMMEVIHVARAVGIDPRQHGDDGR